MKYKLARKTFYLITAFLCIYCIWYNLYIFRGYFQLFKKGALVACKEIKFKEITGIGKSNNSINIIGKFGKFNTTWGNPVTNYFHSNLKFNSELFIFSNNVHLVIINKFDKNKILSYIIEKEALLCSAKEIFPFMNKKHFNKILKLLKLKQNLINSTGTYSIHLFNEKRIQCIQYGIPGIDTLITLHLYCTNKINTAIAIGIKRESKNIIKQNDILIIAQTYKLVID